MNIGYIDFRDYNTSVDLGEGIHVERYSILGTTMFVHRVWVLDTIESWQDSPFTTFKTEDNDGSVTRFGEYTSFWKRQDFAHLPVGSDERSAAIKAHSDKLESEAYALIIKAFPYCEALTEPFLNRTHGEISCVFGDIV